MLQSLAIAGGGAIGALLRYWSVGAVHGVLGRDFPWGTLMVNVAGSLLMGIAWVWLVDRALLGGEWRSLLMVGGLGAFTTFSTFSIETLRLLEDGRLLLALLNVMGSVLLCLLAVWGGALLARQWL